MTTHQSQHVPTLDDFSKLACDLLLRDGAHLAMIHGYVVNPRKEKGDLFIAGLPAMPKHKVVRFAMMKQVGKQMNRQHGRKGTSLTDLFFVSEAWMVKAQPHDELDNMPSPADHPERIEILMIVHCHLPEQTYDMRIFEFVRSGDSLDLSPAVVPDGYTGIYSELINHFLLGYGITPKKEGAE